jgi:hypothetical protein
VKLFKRLKQINDAISAPFNKRFPRVGKMGDWVEKHAYPIFGICAVAYIILAVWTYLDWDLGLFIASLVGVGFCIFMLAMIRDWKSNENTQ